MIVAAPTAEHSGTRFLIDLFRREGFVHNNTPFLVGGPDIVVQVHFGQKNWQAFEELVEDRGFPIVIPVRRLHSVFLSWEARGKNTDLLDERIGLMTEWSERSPYWLPIDSDDRDEWLDEVRDGLGLKLETDWPIIGSDKHTNGKTEDRIQDQAGYTRLRDKFAWFYEQIYRA